MRTALLRLGRHSAPLHLLLIRARIPKLCSRPTLLLLPLRVAFRALGFDLLLPRSLPQSAFVLLPVICMVLLLFFFCCIVWRVSLDLGLWFCSDCFWFCACGWIFCGFCWFGCWSIGFDFVWLGKNWRFEPVDGG